MIPETHYWGLLYPNATLNHVHDSTMAHQKSKILPQMTLENNHQRDFPCALWPPAPQLGPPVRGISLVDDALLLGQEGGVQALKGGVVAVVGPHVGGLLAGAHVPAGGGGIDQTLQSRALTKHGTDRTRYGHHHHCRIQQSTITDTEVCTLLQIPTGVEPVYRHIETM